ncbi:glutamate receptor ionotropic, kainate 2-like [Anthonomus grandis grandis]|uniref:glutamate receptor ionotropic, kainate 2-like n=1 Tax=Anthonomus grandis grandis TaxID=2921223 RepID=UPI0021653E0A|nr:glutamate receptor ionotropic, kainate 2-like [Anthonomus grandis grandis]
MFSCANRFIFVFFTLLPNSGFTQTIVNIGICLHEGDLENFNIDTISGSASKDYLHISAATIMVPDDILDALHSICDKAALENGLTAIIGHTKGKTDNLLKSTSSFLGIPYINTQWIPREFTDIPNSFSVYPDTSMLALAYGAIVKSLSWSTFAIVYENEESLIRLQDVIKLQQYNKDAKRNSVILRKLHEADSRPIFKEIRHLPIYSVLLDCSIERTIEVLQQAKDVKLLDDINTNFFLTSLDAHTLNFTALNSKTNLTTVRLFNPFTSGVQRHTRKYYPNIDPNQISVKTALMHDAMLLLAESLNAIKSTHADGEIVYEPLFCNAPEKYSDKYGLVSALQEATVEGITGQISLPNGKREGFELEIIEIFNREEPIGTWDSNDPEKVVLKRNATQREADIQKRLQNHNFIVTSRLGGPYLYQSKDPEATGNARYYGYSMDLISEIAKEMNITFEFQITKDNAYGNLQQDLIDRRADLAICDFTITPQRREVIDFSLPFMSLGIGILHTTVETAEEANLYGFLGPLSTVVWLYIGLLYLILSFVLVLIARCSTEDWENPHPCEQNPSELENIWDLKNCCWLTLGSITTQGCDLLPKGTCTRIATASWWFFSLIITSSYTANLAAFLTMSKQEATIDSVEELAVQNKIKYGLVQGGSTATFFKNSNNSLYQRMWNTMVNEKPSVFESDNIKGVERVESTKNGLYAYFMESTGIEYEMERRCKLRRIGNLLDSKSYGIGMPMDAEYRHKINNAILKLAEVGKLTELKEKWWKLEREGKPCPVQEPVNTDALALVNVGGVFIVLGAGIALAFFIAILEFLWNCYNISVEEHITFTEALKIELKFACNIFITRKRAKPVISEASSEKSDKEDDAKSHKGILPGLGSFLNVSMLHVDEHSARSPTPKSGSKRRSS